MDAQALVMLDPKEPRLLCSGAWDIENLAKIKAQLNKIALPPQGELIIDGQAVNKMDSAGAWLLSQFLQKVSSSLKIQLQHFSEQAEVLLSLVGKQVATGLEAPKIQRRSAIAHLGYLTLSQLREFRDYLRFTGDLTFDFMRDIFHPQNWRWQELVNVIDKTGLKALPIIALLSFMIGVVIVLAY